MKILTAAQMGEIDDRTCAAGIPHIVLMENAAHRVVEAMEREFSPLSQHRILIFCGAGNNGGDGLAIARLLWIRFRPASLDVVIANDPHHQVNLLRATGFTNIHKEVPPEARLTTIVVDALLGTGTVGAPRGRIRELITTINTEFPLAKVVSVDLPSGCDADSGEAEGEQVRADLTITFTAPKPCHLLGTCLGKVIVSPIGTPEAMLNDIRLFENEPRLWRRLLAPRDPEGHKGTYGHVLVIGGAPGKTGAAAMTGLAALRMGAGLVTVASSACTLPVPELMTQPLDSDWSALVRDSVALGPGLGENRLVPAFVQHCPAPMVVDADGLNILSRARPDWYGAPRVFTPHPGEMERLLGRPVEDRIADAQDFAADWGVILVLKGHRTVIAHPDGRTAINPTGSPALATAGSGDILTGLIATLLAQTDDAWEATLAGVYLHGLAGELAGAELTDACVIATDLLRYLPEAIRRCG